MRLLSLCDKSGVWSAPYLAAGWEVVRVDLSSNSDARLLTFDPPVCGLSRSIGRTSGRSRIRSVA